MKIVVIQEEIIQTDITPKELTKRWKKLEQLPGIDEVVIEVPAHYPNIEQLHTYIGDADAVFGLWIGPDNMNEAFLSQHPNLKYVATLGHGWEKFDTEMTRKRGISISNTIYGSQTIAEYDRCDRSWCDRFCFCKNGTGIWHACARIQPPQKRRCCI